MATAMTAIDVNGDAVRSGYAVARARMESGTGTSG